MSVMQNPDLDGSQFQLIGNSNVAVILLHGFTATTIEVRPLAEALHAKGMSVYAPLLPGHNTTPDDLNKQKWKDWTESVEQISTPLFEQYENVFIGGESMGGLITCYMASKYPGLKGIMLYSPALSIKNLAYSRFIRLFKSSIPKSSNEPDGFVKPDEFPWKGYRVNPTRAAYQIYLLQQEVGARLINITQPVIIFQGALDQTIDPAGAEIIYDQVNSKEKELVILKNSGHCVILEKEHEVVFNQTISFIQRFSKALED